MKNLFKNPRLIYMTAVVEKMTESQKPDEPLTARLEKAMNRAQQMADNFRQSGEKERAGTANRIDTAIRAAKTAKEKAINQGEEREALIALNALLSIMKETGLPLYNKWKEDFTSQHTKAQVLYNEGLAKIKSIKDAAAELSRIGGEGVSLPDKSNAKAQATKQFQTLLATIADFKQTRDKYDTSYKDLQKLAEKINTIKVLAAPEDPDTVIAITGGSELVKGEELRAIIGGVEINLGMKLNYSPNIPEDLVSKAEKGPEKTI